mgnify:FL=1
MIVSRLFATEFKRPSASNATGLTASKRSTCLPAKTLSGLFVSKIGLYLAGILFSIVCLLDCLLISRECLKDSGDSFSLFEGIGE